MKLHIYMKTISKVYLFEYENNYVKVFILNWEYLGFKFRFKSSFYIQLASLLFSNYAQSKLSKIKQKFESICNTLINITSNHTHYNDTNIFNGLVPIQKILIYQSGGQQFSFSFPDPSGILVGGRTLACNY